MCPLEKKAKQAQSSQDQFYLWVNDCTGNRIKN
jgi:hypothetical protein